MDEKIIQLRDAIAKADAVMIGAGAGLSTAAGYVYTGERFDRYFSNFGKRYGFHDMYSGGFYPYPDTETFWAYWSRYIWINRYAPIPGDVYDRLLDLVRGKDYFVITTNVDHCFQRAGFDKKRLFYTQGDYGLFQSANPHGASARSTYDNKDAVRAMLLAQGFEIAENDALIIPEGKTLSMRIPSGLIPRCPDDGEPMTTNLRSDDRFVEDDGWQAAAASYSAWVKAHRESRAVYLEIGVGYNTPGIIKYNFWQQVYENSRALYACLNMEGEPAPREIADRSIVIAGDSAAIIRELVS